MGREKQRKKVEREGGESKAGRRMGEGNKERRNSSAALWKENEGSRASSVAEGMWGPSPRLWTPRLAKCPYGRIPSPFPGITEVCPLRPHTQTKVAKNLLN